MNYNDHRALIVGTGPSLKKDIDRLHLFDGLIFAINNTPYDLRRVDCWIACDPKWHDVNGYMPGDFDKWHWDFNVAKRYEYLLVDGVWKRGLVWDDPTKISFNHCSTAQAINLAVNQYQVDELVLVGHDFHYPRNQPRHYFTGLSDIDGEYPEPIRKHSDFIKVRGPDLSDVYLDIATDCERHGVKVWNATPGSKLRWFPYRPLDEFLFHDWRIADKPKKAAASRGAAADFVSLMPND